MNLGAQYYTIRDYCRTIEDFELSCKKVAEIGYSYIQLSGIGDFSGEEIKTVIDKYGLKVVCTHRPPANYLENIEKEIEFHKTIGCNICGIGAMPTADRTDKGALEFADKFTPVAKRLNEEGLIFAYHNHAFEFAKYDGKYLFDIICDKMASDNFKTILDVYWLSFAGINPAKFIREHSKNIACIHFKDLKISGNAPVYAEVGEGNLDWDDIISACRECGVNDILVEQDDNWADNDPFISLKISYDYLKEAL